MRGMEAHDEQASADEPCVCLTTVADVASAGRLARALLEARLIACANLVPGVTSIYRWKGSVQEDAEVLIMLKTTRARIAALEAAVLGLHPYECPELVVLAPAHVEARYRAWLVTETAPSAP
jgi:periplasmic divalent cation tolerance protein